MPRKSKTIRCVLYARVSNDRQDVDNSNEHPGIGRSPVRGNPRRHHHQDLSGRSKKRRGRTPTGLPTDDPGRNRPRLKGQKARTDSMET